MKDEDASVRMAGVYALERLALEPNARYAETVVNVLAGFVRERTTRPDYPPQAKSDHLPFYRSKEEMVRDPNSYETSEKALAGGWSEPTEPVKAAVSSLSNICQAYWSENNIIINVDLRGVPLPRLEANGFFMKGWVCERANLQGTQFWRSKLQDAQLTGANLHGAQLEYANLQGAQLERANLQNAWLGDANLRGAQFVGADLQDTYLVDANLQDAWLEDANLQDAQLTGANLQGAELGGANLQGAELLQIRNWRLDQFEQAVWPAGAPPQLPEGAKVVDDKYWCTDDSDKTKLHPKLLGETGQFKGVPYGFRERREEERREQNPEDKTDG